MPVDLPSRPREYWIRQVYFVSAAVLKFWLADGDFTRTADHCKPTQ